MSSSGAARTVTGVELDRRAFRRAQSRRSVLISLLSTLVVAAAIWVGVVNTRGWALVQQSFFDPAEAVKALPSVLVGLLVNLTVLVVAAVGVAIVATALAIIRTLRGAVFAPLRFLAAAYTDFFRGMPLLIVLYLVGFGVPGLAVFPPLDVRLLGTIALVISYSAYVAEVLRAGIESVHPSQRLAARSLGLSHRQTLRLIVLPQAVRRVAPALVNDFVSMQKDVGLISILGAVDAVRAAQIQVSLDYNFTPYVVAGVLFVLISLPFIRVTDWLAARARTREQAGGLV